VSVTIRPETPSDAPGVRLVNEAGFGRRDEADIVDRLREDVVTYLGLVAVEADRVIGHIAFSGITMEPPRPDRLAVGLAPMAVLPQRQREGIGSALVREGLSACRRAGADLVFVLGHPTYYPRFGFEPAANFGVRCAFEVPPEAFLVLALSSNALDGVEGVAHYASPLND
jgi:putative acetyltransferase